MTYKIKTYEPSEEATIIKPQRIPAFILKMMLKRNVHKIREMMGGNSKDITTRPIQIKDYTIKGYKESIRVRTYSPGGEHLKPLMLFYHGGGWIGGSIDAVEEYCKAVSDSSDCVVVSVDYTLAPEGKFPTGLEDAYQALLWAVKSADTLNIDPNNVCVSGDSAGGNFAAVLSIMARDRSTVKIKKQILLYPATDLVNDYGNKATSTEKAFGQTMLELYLNHKDDKKNPHVSPIMCTDLTDLPKTLIAVGDLDNLKLSAKAYAQALEAAGNDVTFLLFENTAHAFIDDTGNSAQALDIIDEVKDFMTHT